MEFLGDLRLSCHHSLASGRMALQPSFRADSTGPSPSGKHLREGKTLLNHFHELPHELTHKFGSIFGSGCQGSLPNALGNSLRFISRRI